MTGEQKPVAEQARVAAEEAAHERKSGAFGQAPVQAPPRTLKTRLFDALLAILRDPNPILLKELRATLRTPLFVRFLYLSTGIVAIVVLMGSASVSEGGTAPAEVGRAIYHLFFCAIALVLLFAAPSHAAAAFTLEKETKTWESLLLSGMSPTRIVLGKFFAVYGSILLVVIAVAPVIGVAFLFGGVSPVAVLVAFYWLLGCAGIAVSFGIAVSVRLDSTRASVAATSAIFIPLALMWSVFIVALGEPARSEWGTPFDGPIWFGPGFAERSGELDAWLLLLVLPTFFFSMLTWLNLAGAIAGIDAPGVDRSRGLKLWSLYAAAGTAITVVSTAFLTHDADDAGEVVVASALLAMATVFPVIALVLAGEPPLAPRIGRPTTGLRRFIYELIGPGAGPTLRFSFAVLTVGIMAIAVGSAAVRYLRFPLSSDNAGADLAVAFMAAGGISVLAALAATAAWLRAMLRNGAAARMLALVFFVALVFGSLVLASVMEPRAIDHMDRNLNPVIGLSPIGPLVLAVRYLDNHPPHDEELATGITACAAYALLALALWIAVEVRARRVGRLVADHRTQLLTRLGPVPSARAIEIPTPPLRSLPSATNVADPPPDDRERADDQEGPPA